MQTFLSKIISVVAVVHLASLTCLSLTANAQVAQQGQAMGSSDTAVLDGNILSFDDEKPFRKGQDKLEGGQSQTLGGFDVVVWEPQNKIGKAPLVIFSHGFRGRNSRSNFLMRSLCDAGYLVVAPNHRDSSKYGMVRAQENFYRVSAWSDKTYRDRELDISKLVDTLHKDPQWNSRIDWTKFALIGHSLGGYTVLGLAGAWPSWKMRGVKAVIALSPYCNPYLRMGALDSLDVPIMYQGGTRDRSITPFLKSKNGAFDQTKSPSVFVEFDGASHFAWTNWNMNKRQEALISHYCIEFFDKYVLGRVTATPEQKLPGVSMLLAK